MSNSTISFQVPRSKSYFDQPNLLLHDYGRDREDYEFIPSPENKNFDGKLSLSRSSFFKDFESKDKLQFNSFSDNNDSMFNESLSMLSPQLITEIPKSLTMTLEERKQLNRDLMSAQDPLLYSRSVIETNDSSMQANQALLFNSVFTVVSNCQFQKDDFPHSLNSFMSTPNSDVFYPAQSRKDPVYFTGIESDNQQNICTMVNTTDQNESNSNTVIEQKDEDGKNCQNSFLYNKQSDLFSKQDYQKFQNLSEVFENESAESTSYNGLRNTEQQNHRTSSSFTEHLSETQLNHFNNTKTKGDEILYDSQQSTALSLNLQSHRTHKAPTNDRDIHTNPSKSITEQSTLKNTDHYHTELPSCQPLPMNCLQTDTGVEKQNFISFKILKQAETIATELSNFKTQELLLALVNARTFLKSAYANLDQIINQVMTTSSNNFKEVNSHGYYTKNCSKHHLALLPNFIHSLISTLHTLFPGFLDDCEGSDNVSVERHQIILAHPDEFKNPSSFLKVYGDPQCITETRENNGLPVDQPSKGINGNWECSKCHNINYPRRFRCNNHGCRSLRDTEGDQLVSEYTRHVFYSYLVNNAQYNKEKKIQRNHHTDFKANWHKTIENPQSISGQSSSSRKYENAFSLMNTQMVNYNSYNNYETYNVNNSPLVYQHISTPLNTNINKYGQRYSEKQQMPSKQQWHLNNKRQEMRPSFQNKKSHFPQNFYSANLNENSLSHRPTSGKYDKQKIPLLTSHTCPNTYRI